MRKQYHFRPSGDGLRAWDVGKLVMLARSLPLERVLLSEIRELDEPYWSNFGTRDLTCRDIVDHARLIQACDLRYPIILSSDGRVMDGMHRVARALLEGQTEIAAVRFTEDPEPDYVGMSPDELPY
jgi:hypothetical protein